MESINIGLIEATLNSGNMGCNALTYSAILLLEEVSELLGKPFNYNCFTNFSPESISLYSDLENKTIRSVPPRITLKQKAKECLKLTPKAIAEFYRDFRSCDVYFEIAGGDSFSDIYGIDRLYKYQKFHRESMKKGSPLIFLPQTIGPFASERARKIAKESLSYADRIFTRDPLSYQECCKYASANNIYPTIDMAFFMNYERRDRKQQKVQVGLNPSGLLWNGGYSGGNQFGLREDYKAVVRSVINLLKEAGVEVILTSHVLYGPQYQVEDDYKVCRWLHQEFPFCKVAPFFYTPSEAKSYISGFDLLIGSRMHCCIAAYSSGVPVYPLGYSRKFNGLFREELGWLHGSDLVSDPLDETLAGLKIVLKQLPDLQKEMPRRLERISSYKQPLIDGLKSVFSSVVS